MAKLTVKEWYDELVGRSAAGLFPAVDDYGKCRYRTKDGRKCAVGVLIPDEIYNSCDIERLSVTVITEKVGLGFIPKGVSVRELKTVQQLHDVIAMRNNGKNWNHEEFVTKLKKISCFANFLGVT